MPQVNDPAAEAASPVLSSLDEFSPSLTILISLCGDTNLNRKESGMNGLRIGAIFLGAISMFAGGCQNQLHDDNMSLHDQNKQLQTELDDARQRLADSEGRLAKAPDPAALAQMQSHIAELENQLKQTPATAGSAGGSDDPAMAGIEAKYDKARGTLTVNLPGAILFEPGKAALKATANPTLDKIAAAIKKDYSSKMIFVDGHTDSDPITRTKDTWEDNWDLAAARANAVRRYLTTHGVDSKKIDLRAFGPNRPKGSKPASRRVEIVVQVG
jgi:flagellar motor protein MotB